MNVAPAIHDVVLVGGGHSHVIFIRMWAMQPLPGVRLTLISEKVDTPYSGMLPGLIAGHYSADEVHIDLASLCVWANVRFIERRVEGIDLAAKHLHVNDQRPPVEFDVLSLDTGSTPELSVSGSDEFSVPVKPVHGFYQRWQAILARMAEHNANESKPVSVGVVGSGAGGYELIMAMRHVLATDNATCHWFVRGQRALKGRPLKVSEIAMHAAERAGVQIHKGFDVIDVNPQELVARDGRKLAVDEIIWCTAAKAPDWPKQAGLRVDDRGFVYTNKHLQSVSHDCVFATGDIGTQLETPSAKAGVFAVRQAPVLFQNVRRYLLGKPLKTYEPQTDFLSLMATGEKAAIGNRGFLTVKGAWVWQWKNFIDRKFMDRFRRLPAMAAPRNAYKVPASLLTRSSVSAEDVSNAAMRCRGCGGKVGGTILDSVLRELNIVDVSGVIAGLDIAGDAAVVDLSAASEHTNSSNHRLVQSIDQISAVCADPYQFGQIAAVHALSDIVAVGSTPHSAQVIVTLPFADKRIVKRDLAHAMAGAVDALNAEDCALVGGHTAEGAELTMGFVVNGFSSGDTRHASVEAKVGDKLVLTKPIGSGVLLAGMMRQQAKGRDVQAVLRAMQQSNRKAADELYANHAIAITDITGFGLLGHLQRLLQRIACSAELLVNTIPVYDGAMSLAQRGFASTLLEQNQHVLSQVGVAETIDEAWLNILCDPQTSGGLLAVVPAEKSESILNSLRAAGYEPVCEIGCITEMCCTKESSEPTIQLSV